MESARVIWSLSASGLTTTINSAGNSGGWSMASPNDVTTVDLRYIEDLLLLVNVGGVTGTTPGLVVQLDIFDAVGNLYPGVAKTASITAAGPMTTPLSIGLHQAGANQLVMPPWGRISWTVSGTSPVFTGTEITVFGR